MDVRVMIAILLLPTAFAFCESGTDTSITHYDVTWTFDQAYECGQFVNGDYWVVGPVNIIDIDPPPTEDHWQDALPGYDCVTPNPESVAGYYKIHGSMINPSPGDGQTYDSRCSGFNEDGWIHAPTLSAPLILQPETSLISSVSFTQYCQDGYPGPYGGAMDNALRPSLKSASILSIVDSVPPENAFRPWYSGTYKPIFTTGNIDRSRLASLTRTSSARSISEYETRFQRVWIDHLGNWINEAIQPMDNMPQYGRNYAGTVSEGALLLNTDFTLEEKENLIIYMTQLGLDRYGIIQNGGSDLWTANGGISHGRKFPVIFAGVMLNDQAILDSISNTEYGTPGFISFQEDEQTFYVTQDAVDISHSSSWDPDERAPPLPYDTADIGLPEWGIRHAARPVADNKHWSATYRHLNALAWPGFVLAAHAMGIREQWNHNALFDYQDRHMDVMLGDKYRADSDFQEEMWDLHRDEFGCTWRRIDTTDTYSQGYYDCDGIQIYCDSATCNDYNERACGYDPCNLGCDCVTCVPTELSEVIIIIEQWKTGTRTITQVMNMIKGWKNGC